MPRTLLRYSDGALYHHGLLHEVPWKLWIGLITVAVGGSLLYGSSIALIAPSWDWLNSALWLAGGAGLAWCVFIPALWKTTGVDLVRCIHTSLLTMAAGEVVLTSGALVNVLLWWNGVTTLAVAINATIIAISNIVMVAMLALQLRDRVSVSKTVGAWMLYLNGTGAITFALLYLLLHGA